MTYNFINNESFCVFTGLFSVNEYISSKENDWSINLLIYLIYYLNYFYLLTFLFMTRCSKFIVIIKLCKEINKGTKIYTYNKLIYTLRHMFMCVFQYIYMYCIYIFIYKYVTYYI